MKKGEIKSAFNNLANKGGRYSGSSSSILKALSFNGGWREFQELMGENLTKTDEGIYVVTHPDLVAIDNCNEAEKPQFSLESFALCATNYLLGEGEAEDFQAFEAQYDKINDTVAYLSVEVDPEIGTKVYPPETDTSIIMTEVERALFYVASDGVFQVYGGESKTQLAA